MVSILADCANGTGTSLMMGMTLDKIIHTKGYKIEKTGHSSISEGRTVAESYTIVLCPINFVI